MPIDMSHALCRSDPYSAYINSWQVEIANSDRKIGSPADSRSDKTRMKALVCYDTILHTLIIFAVIT